MDINTEPSGDKKKQFSSSKTTYKKFSPWSFAGGMLIVLFAGGILYLAMPNKQKVLVGTNQKTEAEANDTSIFKGEHFYKTHHHKHIDKDAEDIILMPDEENMLEKATLTDKQRKLIELLPNAPVIYLYNLKITEYQKFYYQPDGNPVLIKDTAAPKLISVAMKNFMASQFDISIERLKPLLHINEDDPNALFYTGAAYYYKKDYPHALVMLNRIGNLSNNIFKQEAYWYKALCFIDLQKNNDAKTLLQHIANGQGFYAAKAKELLATLK
ncbi:MAG: hypothetical protein ABI388_12545 [Bacteroidia bacterium]